jgi:hypothetical protein
LGPEGKETFKITVDASGASVTGTTTCAGVNVPLSGSSLLQDAFGSATRNGSGYFARIETDPLGGGVRETIQGNDAFVPENLSYQFNAYLYPGCD